MSEALKPAQARMLVLALGAALVLYTAGRVLEWSGAERLPGAKIVRISDEHNMRRSSGTRRELTVEYGGRTEVGRMTTYWGLGTPEEGEVVDLRITRGAPYSELHFDAWGREFGSSLLALRVAMALGGGLWWRLGRGSSSLEE